MVAVGRRTLDEKAPAVAIPPGPSFLPRHRRSARRPSCRRASGWDEGLKRLGLAGDPYGRGRYERDRRADERAGLLGNAAPRPASGRTAVSGPLWEDDHPSRHRHGSARSTDRVSAVAWLALHGRHADDPMYVRSVFELFEEEVCHVR